MKTIYITKKINDSDNGSDKINKKLRKIKDKWYDDIIITPIKLVFEEGIKTVNPIIIDNGVLRCLVVEIIYPESLIELPRVVFENVEKIKIPSNLKRLRHGNVSNCKLNDINLHNNLELIDCETFFGDKYLNKICIYPSVKKIGLESFMYTKIKKFIFLSTNVENFSSAFYYTIVDKLYCVNEELLSIIISCISITVRELTISLNLVPKLVQELQKRNDKKILPKLIIDCPNDFYHNMLYWEELNTIKRKVLNCEIILSHNYVVENFEEAKDIYKEAPIDIYSKEINDKCNQILNSSSDIKLKEKVLNYLIDIVKKHNDTILDEECYSYNDFNNISLSINNNYYDNNTFMDKLDDVLNNVNLLNNSILLNNDILLFLDDIEKLITEINISNTSLNYLDESLYSDIYRYLYILELTDSNIKEKYKSNLLNIISNYKDIINKNIFDNISDFPNTNILYKNINEFELEFRKYFFGELSSFYKDYFKSIGIDVPEKVDKAINGIYDSTKDNQRNIYYKVITDLISEIKELNYTKDKYIIERLDNIININLNEVEDDKLYNIIKDLSKIKYFLQYKENMLKEKGLFKLVKRK